MWVRTLVDRGRALGAGRVEISDPALAEQMGGWIDEVRARFPRVLA